MSARDCTNGLRQYSRLRLGLRLVSCQRQTVLNRLKLSLSSQGRSVLQIQAEFA